MRWRFCAPILIAALLLSACGALGNLTGGNKLAITVVYGSEKKAWLEAATNAFNQQQVKTPDGATIEVAITPLGSAESLRQIVAGEIQPTVWSPASGILVPLANERWARDHGGEQLIDDAPPLVLSPVVIAMWDPMARALGWPAKPLGWADLAELASSGKTWADYGYPEWGPFQFGHTHPDYSNSGITSILAMAYASTGKQRGLTLADVQAPQTADFIGSVESAVIHYGESTGFFGDQMFNRGPSYLSAAVLYENLVVQSYDRQLYPNGGTPVVAIYPKEGTFWSDHPYAILDAPWVSAEQRVAAELFRDFLLARPQQEQALQYGFRPADPNVPVSAPIISANGVDPTQPQTLLDVPSVEVIEAAQTLWQNNKKRVDVTVVLDVSGSMEEEGRLERAKTALRDFVGQLADDDGMELITFSSNAQVLSPMSSVGPKRQELLNRIGGLFPNGNTRLVDTVREAYASLSQEPPGDRIRALVVLSDGADNGSGPNATEELLQALQGDESGTSIKVFTIAYGTGTDVNVDLLTQIAAASGAKTYEAGPNGIDQVYRDIATFF